MTPKLRGLVACHRTYFGKVLAVTMDKRRSSNDCSGSWNNGDICRHGYFIHAEGEGRKARKTHAKAGYGGGNYLISGWLSGLYLWLLDLGTFTNYIKGFMQPFFGFCLMILIFLGHWWRSDTVEALDVMFGILMGHFWWSWC